MIIINDRLNYIWERAIGWIITGREKKHKLC